VKDPVGNMECLREVWDTLDVYSDRLEKFITEDLEHRTNFCKYKTTEYTAFQEFYYLLLRSTIMSTKSGRLKIEQTLTSILGRIPMTD
jgi:hypothetical protein